MATQESKPVKRSNVFTQEDKDMLKKSRKTKKTYMDKFILDNGGEESVTEKQVQEEKKKYYREKKSVASPVTSPITCKFEEETELEAKQEKKCEYEKLNRYYKDGKFTFDVSKEPTIDEFIDCIGEPMHLVGRCVLNTPENFPYKTKKDGTQTKTQREYFEDIPTYTGKKVDYLAVDEAKWCDNNNEWLYCLVYNKHIVKIGMTITSLNDRWCGSYSCGTSRAMTKGSCSTTNFIITECNFGAVYSGMDVEIYAVSCPKEAVSVSRFGQTKTIYISMVRGYETMLSQRFHTTYKNKPVLCVQEGK